MAGEWLGRFQIFKGILWYVSRCLHTEWPLGLSEIVEEVCISITILDCPLMRDTRLHDEVVPGGSHYGRVARAPLDYSTPHSNFLVRTFLIILLHGNPFKDGLKTTLHLQSFPKVFLPAKGKGRGDLGPPLYSLTLHQYIKMEMPSCPCDPWTAEGKWINTAVGPR